ncbi:MAG: antibiotic biosynthesis monooxygenase [Gammaproteobacteria bacterium]|nr:antibiotic biosynthesis monooxygenase [Gammaproteobacteria bacterium]
MSDKADFYVLYRWRLHAGMEQQFIDAWTKMTELIKQQRGGLGSRLHHRDDGWWVAYAAWPNKEKWANSIIRDSPDAELAKLMNEAIAERQAPEELLPVRNLVANNQ